MKRSTFRLNGRFVLSPRAAWCSFWLFCVAWAACAGDAVAMRQWADVRSSTPQRLVFRVSVSGYRLAPSAHLEGWQRLRIPGYTTVSRPGEPALPSRTFFVALPPQGSFSVSSRVLDAEGLGSHRIEPVPFPAIGRDDGLGMVTTERYEYDPEIYGDYRAPALAATREAAFIRHQRVLPLIVSPVTYDPAAGETVVATEIEVTVTFSGGEREGFGADRADSPTWERLYGRLLVNPEQARAWRLPRRAEAVSGAPAPLDGTYARLSVRETGVHRVTAAALIAAGFPAAQDVASLHVLKRRYDDDTMVASTVDVAFRLVEDPGGTAGVFDAGDEVVFYGLRLRDDPDQGDVIEKYADHNVYWLGAGGTGGPVMAEHTPAQGFVTADTATASFSAAAHFEEDLDFRETTPQGVDDFYYVNTGTETGVVEMDFEVGHVLPGAMVTVSADLHGQLYGMSRQIEISAASSKGTTVLDPVFSLIAKQRRTFSRSVDPSVLDAGVNRFRIQRPGTQPVQAYLNWVRVSYPSLYRAVGNRLDFNTGTLSGDTSITVTGITDTDVRLFDVTDPDRPVYCDVSGRFVDLGGSQALSFRENLAGTREYVLVPAADIATLSAGDIAMDTESAIVGDPAEAGVDVLVVSHADFLSSMQPWVSYRRAQGYRVLMVDVQDVFDEFNNGVPHARAINRFVRRFFELGNASALLIVGDSTEDNKRVHDDSGPNFVPSHSWPDNVAQLSADEVITTDKRFVKMPGPGGSVDVLPDMIVGRIPVGTTAELGRVLAKIFDFEAPEASDFWRKRMIIVADDEYSEGSSVFGGFQFCDNNEGAFESGQEIVAQNIENSLPAGYDVVRFYLDDYTTAIHGENCVSAFAAIQYTRDNVNPLIMNQLSQGATLVTIQAHMNRSLVTHERLLSTQSAATLGGSTGRDHLRVDNRGKPFIIFGMGCHFSDYALHRELFLTRTNNNNPNGDAFAEQLLFQNDKGAVGTYGSSGFEYLNQTNAFMEIMSEVWFYLPPHDDGVNTTQAQWVFGELMLLTEIAAAITQPNPVERYHILGDPLLRIDAGPPSFDVTVDGAPAQTGDRVVSGGEGDTIQVVAVVTDENAIGDFELEIAGSTDSLLVEQIADTLLTRGRQYRLSFRHKLRPESYDIVVRALQAPDTAGAYQMTAEFTLRVQATVSLAVDGRVVESGGTVPAKGNYRVRIEFPVFVLESQISLNLDGAPVDNLVLSHPAPNDSTTWLADFTASLSPGSHTLIVSVGDSDFTFNLTVGSTPGLLDVVNYPNPFVDATRIVYRNEVEISEGTIAIYTPSGKLVRRLEIPPDARAPGHNAVFWDGRDTAGERIANGVYLYVIRVQQRDERALSRGKMSKLE